MSDKTIRKGDLVMVVRGKPCCGIGAGFGDTYKVDRINTVSGTCKNCGVQQTVSLALAKHHDHGYYASRLLKIDPPATGEYDGVSVRKPIKQREPA